MSGQQSWVEKVAQFARVKKDIMNVLSKKKNRQGIDLAQFTRQFKEDYCYLSKSFDRRFRDLKDKGCVRVLGGKIPLYVFVRFEDSFVGVTDQVQQITF